MESEKKVIERKTAEIFLSLYNPSHGTHFEISDLGESPDVTCIDSQTGNPLYLEITLLENLHGDIAFELGRGKKPISPTTKTTVVDFFNDVVPLLRKRLEKKLLASYGKNTALVLRQVSILWEPMEWRWITPSLKSEVLKGKEAHYGAGIWAICTDNTTWPASDALFCISLPSSDDEGKAA
jgi:hypothetical protein